MTGDRSVIESFRVLDGRVVRPDLHRARFHAATGLGAVFDAALAQVPAQGDWFPRIDAGGLTLRPAPPVGGPVVLWSAPPFTWTCPQVKGPDVARLLALRARAQEHGADEAVLPELEGATSAIAWWEDDGLCTTAAPVLASVTLAVVASLAGGVRRVDPARADLAGREVWCLNALHGIRPVTGWIGGPDVGPAHRASGFQVRYEALRGAWAGPCPPSG